MLSVNEDSVTGFAGADLSLPKTSFPVAKINAAKAASQTVNAFQTMNKIVDWVKNNPLIAGLAVLVAVFLFFPRMLRGIRRKRRYGGKAIRRRKGTRTPVSSYRRRYWKAAKAPSRRTSRRKGLKPWQIKGSLAAKRRMAQIRRRR